MRISSTRLCVSSYVTALMLEAWSLPLGCLASSPIQVLPLALKGQGIVWALWVALIILLKPDLMFSKMHR